MDEEWDGLASTPSDGDLIGLIYRSGESGSWQEFLCALGRRCLAHGALLFDHSFIRSNATILGSLGVDAAMQAAYAQQYGGTNVWVLAQQRMAAGTIVLSQDLASAATLNHNECFQEWHRPLEFDFAIGSNLAVGDGSILKLGVLRSRIVGPMDQTHVMLFRSLMPHLQHALRLAKQKSRLESQARAFGALSCHTAVGLLILSASHRVTDMNEAAGLILRRKDAFLLDSRSMLRLTNPEDEVKLRALLREAQLESPADRRAIGLVVHRKTGRPYFVEMLKLKAPSHGTEEDTTAVALLCIRDPEREFCSAAQVLEDALELTPAEARLAACIAQGLTIREAASRLTIAESTARFVTKRVLSKTDCRRQAELVRLALSVLQ